MSCGRLITCILVFLCVTAVSHSSAAPVWTSLNNYRVVLTVDPGDAIRKNSPATVDIYFQDILAAQRGSTGTFDDDTIEVIAYDASGQPKVFDSTRFGQEQYLLPWRIQKYYQSNQVTLSFVMPDHTYTTYCVYFDTKESGFGKPQRYPGIVGDGDWFTEGYKRREINANRYDTFYDIDGDGDLDLFKGGTEPYVYVYENVGGNKFVDRGRLTNGGELMTFPMDGNNRSWLSVEFCDWDNDGRPDMFIHSPTGPYQAHIIRYMNITPPGGPITFAPPVIVTTNTGKRLGSTGGATMTFVDWDGDGKKDLLLGRDNLLAFHRNIGTDSAPIFADGEYIKANGVEIRVVSPCADVADIDGDGDLDLFLGTESGRIFLFENVGSRTEPVFARGRMIAFHSGGYTALAARVKVADWDGDGLLDFVVGRFWENTHWGEQPKMFGRLYKNVGTPTNPKFVAKDAYEGSPHTERFQICDTIRQNGVRAVDWNNDGLKDLLVGDEDGFVWYFRNTTNHLFPVFAEGEKLMADGKHIKVLGEDDRRVRDGYARIDIADWNNDGKKDLLVADGRGWVWLFLNIGTDANPVLAAGQRLEANGKPIDGTARSSILVCDWDNDGYNDLIYAMVGHFPDADELQPPELYSKYFDWPHRNPGEPWKDRGFLFYKNISADPANPMLAYPQWMRAGPGAGSIIDYTRPNLGSFVDWDGDSKKDFIACEFEHNVRFYKNTSSGAAGVEPAFTSSTSGETIVNPFTVQMISGADAIDWNDDGDIDILTGQGHGGSGLRFYERDYINDYTSNGNTYPVVTVSASAGRLDVSQAVLQADGVKVSIPDAVVTAAFDGFFYMETDGSPHGIRVQMPNHGVSVGDKVDVEGTMATILQHGERYIAAASVSANGTGLVAERVAGLSDLGGADKSFDPATGAGQRGVTDGAGANNIGLLVKVLGRCVVNVRGDYYGGNYVFIDDGSGITSFYRTVDGSYVKVNGVKVEVDDASLAEGDYVVATGISSIEQVNGVFQRRVLVRIIDGWPELSVVATPDIEGLGQ